MRVKLNDNPLLPPISGQMSQVASTALPSHFDDLAKSKFQADLEGTFEVMDAHLSQEVELQPPLRK